MTDQDIQQTQQLLAQLEPGTLPPPIFEEVTRLSVTAILELVPYRRVGEGKFEILVIPQSQDDPHWPGQLHTPGTVLLPTDSDDYREALERAFAEVGRQSSGYAPQYVGTLFHTVSRGKELTLVLAVEITDEREKDHWIALAEVPEVVIDTQVTFIEHTVAKVTAQENHAKNHQH